MKDTIEELFYTICIYKYTLKISTYKNVHIYSDKNP